MFDVFVAFLLAVLVVGLLLDSITLQFPGEEEPETLLRRGLRDFGEWMRQ